MRGWYVSYMVKCVYPDAPVFCDQKFVFCIENQHIAFLYLNRLKYEANPVLPYPDDPLFMHRQ
jgi:hypothetical protein